MKLRTALLMCAFVLAIAGAVVAQTVPAATAPLARTNSDISVTGKVISSTSTELVMDNDAGQRMTFVLDPQTSSPTAFTVGARVTVLYHTQSGGTAYQAASISVLPPAAIAPQVAEVTTPATPRLPRTASGLPLLGLLGLFAASGALAVRVARS